MDDTSSDNSFPLPILSTTTVCSSSPTTMTLLRRRGSGATSKRFLPHDATYGMARCALFASKATVLAAIRPCASVTAAPPSARTTVERLWAASALTAHQNTSYACDTHNVMPVTLEYGVALFTANVPSTAVPASHITAAPNTPLSWPSGPETPPFIIMDAPAMVDISPLLKSIIWTGHLTVDARPARPIRPERHALFAKVTLSLAVTTVTTR